MRVRWLVCVSPAQSYSDGRISTALTWFEDHFNKCHERAALVKTWLPAQYTGPPTFLDQLVYDRALMLVRCYIFCNWYLLPTMNAESDSCSQGAA